MPSPDFPRSGEPTPNEIPHHRIIDPDIFVPDDLEVSQYGVGPGQVIASLTHQLEQTRKELSDALRVSENLLNMFEKNTSRLELAEAELYTDPLTGKPNRKALVKKLAQLVVDQPGRVGVLFTDIDGLKPINDTEGHQAGDELIRKTTDVLDDNLSARRGDIVGHGAFRLSGDEIVGIVAGLTSKDQLPIISDRLAGAFELEGVQVSIGHAQHEPDQTGIQLMTEADTQMSSVKDQRRAERQMRDRANLNPENREAAEDMVTRLNEIGMGVEGFYRLFGKKSR